MAIPRDDEQIKLAVVNELRWDVRIDAANVKVTVHEGVATLTGSVPSATARLAAVNTTRFVAGVHAVVDHLVVTLPQVGTIPPDHDIRDRAESALAWNDEVESSGVSVGVDAGTVTLTGNVSTHWEKTRAEQLVAGLSGVIAVRNDLAVVPTGDLEDEVIGEEIMAALERSAAVDAAQVDVTVSLGTVTLAGQVSSAVARQVADDIASRTRGVVAIRDELRIAA